MSHAEDDARVGAPRTATITGRDLGLAAGIAAAWALLYLLTPQARVYGDGVWMVDHLPPSPRQLPHHPLYRPAYSALVPFTPWMDLITRIRFLSQLTGALGLGGTFLIVRAFGLGRRAGVFACALLGSSPLLWFFSTQIEVHALHFAMVVLCACVVLFGPWRRSPHLALFLSAAVLPLAFLSHQMYVLLGSGWVLLAEFARRRRGAGSFGVAGGLFYAGPVLLAGLMVGLALEHFARSGAVSLDVSRETEFLDTFVRADGQLQMFWAGWLKPVALMAPLAVLGLWQLRREGLGFATLCVLLGVPWLFLIGIYDVTERGGFFLGSVPFLVVCVARAVPRHVGIALCLVVAQACLAWWYRGTFDYGYDPEVRVERVRAAFGKDSGLLVVGHPFAPSLSLYLPEAKEVSLENIAERMILGGLPPEAIGQRIPLRGLDLSETPVVIDLTYARRPDFEEFSTVPEFYELFESHQPYYAAFASWVEENFETTLLDDPYWPLLKLERRR